MIKKYVSKFTIDILPSIVATIVGAYIVNHYIVPKSGDAPAAATASAADPAKATAVKAPEKPAETSADVTSIPDNSPAKAKAADKSDKPADTASAPADRRHQPPREKAVAKATPAVVTPPVATASVAPAGEAAATAAEERRDANDLARAAIERLRGANEGQAHPQEAARAPEPVRAPEPPRIAAAPSVQPLPPAIMVSTPPSEAYIQGQGAGSYRPSYPAPEAAIDPRRPRPPGDIPTAQPMDIQADATGSTRRDRTSVAEDVLSAAKSVFHALPRPFER